MGQSTEELNVQIADTRDTLASDLDALQDKVSPRAAVQRQKNAVGDRWRSVRSKVMGSGGSGSSSSGPVDTLKGGAGNLAGSTEDRVVGSPIAAGLVAFGAGVVIAGLIPASDKESELSQRALDTVKDSGLVDEAKAAGQEIAENLKPEAQQAAQQVKDSATQSAQRVSDEGKSATERVRSQTS